jgi:phage terminase large subunit
MTAAVKIEYVDKLYPIFTIPKRVKIVVGGRGSTKSTGVADLIAAKMHDGELWCCAREQLNSIDESVHRTLLDEIERLGISGFESTKTSIEHSSGGRAFYRGLSRNITSLKSTLSGIDGLWIEEGEDLTDNTLRVLTASVRLNATDTQRAMVGEDVKMPEIVITMNRGTRAGAVAKKFLARAEKELERCGYYEDDYMMVVEMNYTDMPEDWFVLSGLEQERIDDKEKLSTAEYEHKWLGKYLETVDGAIIKPEWVDAAKDAHKLEHLKAMFKPHGMKVAAHDPSDKGPDSKGYALRHGSIISHVMEMTTGEVDDGCDWAIDLCKQHGADHFVWDGDGMGSGLKRQVATDFDGTRIQYHMFKGSLAGIGQDNGKEIYAPIDNENVSTSKTYADTFKNNRARYYYDLADRLYNTYRAVVKGEYVDPGVMISFDSETIEHWEALKSELCRIPRKKNNVGLKQIMSKEEMKSIGIDSPNMADSVMMLMTEISTSQEYDAIICESEWS